MNVDVAIVGGGPAGLAAAHAIRIARPHTTIGVYERSDMRPRGAVFGIVPNGCRAIEAIQPDLLATLRKHHAAPQKSRRFAPDGTLLFSSEEGGMSGRAKEYGGESLSLAWHSLQSSLAEALPPGLVHWQHAYLGHSETSEGVLLELDTPGGTQRVAAQLLIGCDGGQSQVRERMLGDGPPTFLGTAIWRAVRPMPHDWVVDSGWVTYGAPGQASIVVTTLGNGMLAWQAFAPWPIERLHEIGGGRRSYIQDSGSKAADANGRSPPPSEIGAQRLARALAALDSFPEQVKQLMATTDPLAVTEHGQFAREADKCTTYARGRVALTGDAAHLMTPMLGQGCSQALEDAVELGRAIGACGPTPEALAEYERVRHPQASRVQAASVQLFKNLAAGDMSISELDVNLKEGFMARQFEPLTATTAAAP